MRLSLRSIPSWGWALVGLAALSIGVFHVVGRVYEAEEVACLTERLHIRLPNYEFLKVSTESKETQKPKRWWQVWRTNRTLSQEKELAEREAEVVARVELARKAEDGRSICHKNRVQHGFWHVWNRVFNPTLHDSSRWTFLGDTAKKAVQGRYKYTWPERLACAREAYMRGEITPQLRHMYRLKNMGRVPGTRITVYCT